MGNRYKSKRSKAQEPRRYESSLFPFRSRNPLLHRSLSLSLSLSLAASSKRIARASPTITKQGVREKKKKEEEEEEEEELKNNWLISNLGVQERRDYGLSSPRK